MTKLQRADSLHQVGLIKCISSLRARARKIDLQNNEISPVKMKTPETVHCATGSEEK